MKSVIGKLVEVAFYVDGETIPQKEHDLIGTVKDASNGWILVEPSEEIELHNYPQYLYMDSVWINLRYVTAVRLIRVGEMAKEPELE